MPRVLDFTQGNETDWNEVRLDEPVYGTREITAGEIDALYRAKGEPISGFSPQFSTYGMSAEHERFKDDRANVMDKAHAWLSEHATGPWAWTEHWTNHGHHIDIAVYVERIPDQEAFAAAHADIFKYRPSDDFEMMKTVVTRGILPGFTAQESFYVWSRENTGFDFLNAEDLGENGWRVAFSHPRLEEMFVERWGADFTAREIDGKRVHEAVLGQRSWRDSPAVWLDRNAAIGSMSGGPSPEGYVYTVPVRFEDTAAALRAAWGHVFTTEREDRTFVAPDYPSPPQRAIPEDYLAYVRGESETYEAPHLPDSVRAYYESVQPAGPAP